MKMLHSNFLPDSPAVQQLTMVQNSSHTPQGAFGYLLSQINPLSCAHRWPRISRLLMTRSHVP